MEDRREAPCRACGCTLHSPADSLFQDSRIKEDACQEAVRGGGYVVSVKEEVLECEGMCDEIVQQENGNEMEVEFVEVRMGSLFDENGLRRSARIQVKEEEKYACSDSEGVGEVEDHARESVAVTDRETCFRSVGVQTEDREVQASIDTGEVDVAGQTEDSEVHASADFDNVVEVAQGGDEVCVVSKSKTRWSHKEDRTLWEVYQRSITCGKKGYGLRMKEEWLSRGMQDMK